MIPIFEQGLIMGIMALGVFISFRILDMADLTVEGSFPLGGAVCITLMVGGMDTWLSLLIGSLVAGSAGILTAIIHTKLKVNVLLAGILVMTMIYSVNLRVMDGPNLPIPRVSNAGTMGTFEEITGSDPLADLFEDMEIAETHEQKAETKMVKVSENIFNSDQNGSDLLLIGITAGICVVLLGIFLKTDLGTVMRGFGSNKKGVESFGIPSDLIVVLGLGLANTLVGFSGGLFCLYGGFADVSMGQGMIVTGLAIVMIGEITFRSFKPVYGLIAPLVGGIIYQFILAMVMRYGYTIGFRASDMKLLTALFIIGVVGISLIGNKGKKNKISREVKRIWSNSKA